LIINAEREVSRASQAVNVTSNEFLRVREEDLSVVLHLRPAKHAIILRLKPRSALSEFLSAFTHAELFRCRVRWFARALVPFAFAWDNLQLA